MITKTLFSRHINKKQLNKQDVLIIEQDIVKFNKMKHRAVRLQNKKLTESLHQTLKHEYGVNDYFTNSARKEAEAAIKAAKEALIRDVNNKESQLKQKQKKVKELTKRLSH